MKQQNRTQGMKPSDFADRSDKEEDDHPSVSTDPEGSAQSRDIIEEGIARHETKAVGRTKLAVLLVMVVSATVVAASVFLYLSGTEQAQFEKQFIEDSHKVLESFGSSLGKSFGMLDELAVNLVAFSKATNQTWPFVTTPSFAARMAKLVPSTSAVNINILHIVTPEDREEWDTYSVENDQWVNEAMEVQETFDGYYGPIVYNGTKNVGVHSDFGAVPLNAR